MSSPVAARQPNWSDTRLCMRKNYLLNSSQSVNFNTKTAHALTVIDIANRLVILACVDYFNL